MDPTPAPHLAVRRDRLAETWGRIPDVVLVSAGEPVPIPGGADQEYPFLAHTEYVWLTDRNEPGGVVAFDTGDGWTDFGPQVTESQRVWEGRTESFGRPMPELAAYLSARRGRRVIVLGAGLPGLSSDPRRTAELRDLLSHARRPKDAIEVARIRRAADATAAGFAAGRAAVRPGATERQVRVEIEAAFARAGADRPLYSTIVGAGPNAAVLHFSPSGRAVRPGDPVLIDAGAEIDRYGADVTRTYFADEPPAALREVFGIVLAAHRGAIAACKPGAEWRELHLAAARTIAAGLVGMGVLRGDPDGLVEQDAHALFFPHGLGHLVGLGVRDASGYLPGRSPSPRPGLASLRMDLPLRAGYVTTVEPGVYFIPALLNDAARRAKFASAVNWSLVGTLLGLGGVRLEDNILVTDHGPENLTGQIPL